MLAVFLVLLFILQIFSFYIIALLYMKVSKFSDLEKKQQKLMAEMDDAIGAYLNELKEENDRLIQIIDKRSDNTVLIREHVEEKTKKTIEDLKNDQTDTFSMKPMKFPVNAALKSYQSSVPKVVNETEENHYEEKKDVRSVVIRMNDEGKSIEEIAKKLGKGKTEIELLLKFK